MRYKGVTVVLLAAVLAGGMSCYRPAPLFAQTIFSGGIIAEVRVEGTQRIEPETVRSYLRVNPGEPFDSLLLDESLKSIFATGLFADVTLRRAGDVLIVTVVENPIINRIAFEGNDRIDDDTMAAEIELRPRTVFTRAKVQNDVQRIVKLFRQSGRYGATVEPKAIQLPQNRVDLVFEINEGPSTGIKSIDFIGNREFSDGDLRGEITTSESAFWRFLSTTDTYDPDRLTFDRELLRRFYLSEGYADFRVLSAIAELAPDREGFIITFTLEEGERYRFGKIAVTSTLRDLDPESLKDELTSEEGEWYDASVIEESVDNLSERLSNLGYAFVDIRPATQRNREDGSIDLTYKIQQGPKVFVERIDVQGNVRTLDEVVRREFRLVEGDAFNSAKLRRSRRQIQNLGYFGKVDITNEPGSAPDKTVITVDVEEQSTGDLSFGAGFSSTSGPLGNIGLRERNLLGKGQDLRLNFTLAAENSSLNLSFTEPYFLDRNLAAGFDLFRLTADQDESSFDEERIGGSLRAGYNLVEDVRQVWRYTLQQEDIRNVDDDASVVVKDDEGKRVQSSVSQELTFDTRDSRFDPHDGMIVSMSAEFAGLGGDVQFLKSTIGGAYYQPITEQITVALKGETGLIFGIGQDTRVGDRFFMSSESLRGFKFAGVGPRDALTRDALGGKKFYNGTLEISFPLGLPEELQIRGRLFSDIGAAWGVDGDVQVFDSSSPRVSVGAGFSWFSPLGPFQLDLGYAQIKEDFDETEVLRFSFGTRF
ncbi:MAG: outer membrane protein assembly factor BamA [Rhodospirillales bacterium]|nr:outer membrane protein assembly factor BamA [Rhodospirillales bacterium]MDH3917888.1 outer membrane protein assembly factor BamA [Rhodospirillales bacterium]MDH3966003.1 outer membrane protein assembly factor BamA [Rhodospirillales bacterium]